MSGLWRKLQTTVAGGAIIISVATVVSKIVGLIRDRLLFSTFGAGDATDVYFAAFKLPDLIFNILVLGALSAAFIPVFIEFKEREGEQGTHWRIASVIMNVVVLLMIFLGLVAFVLAPLLVRVIAPGFDEVKQDQTIILTRIMLMAIVFFGISNVLSGILNATRRFVAYSLAPIMYNIGIIIGIVALYPAFGLSGLAWGVVMGALLHMAIQIPSVRQSGFRHSWELTLNLPGVRQIGKLFLPRTLGLAITQINFLIETIIASTLAAGSLSIYTAANNLQTFPISVFGVSLAIAVFPLISQAVATNDTEKFVVHFSTTVRRILFLIIPTSVMILLLRAQIVRVILGAGAFDWDATILTAQALGYFSLSLFAQSLLPVLSRSFYAHQDTKTPVKISMASVALNLTLSLIFVRFMGVIGLALSFSITNIITMLTYVLVLRRRVGYLDDSQITKSVLRIVAAAIAAGFITWVSLHVIALGVNMHTFVGIALQGIVSGVIGMLSYIIIALVFRFDEVTILRTWATRRLAPLRNLTNGDKQSD